MSALIEKFEICSQINQNIKQNIKIFHVFDDIKGYNVLFITSDDKVFGFGSNCFGCCGLGHNSVVNEPQIIPELCNRNIQQFFIGYSFILALDKNKQVYSWGNNYCGQLGREFIFEANACFRPNVIDFKNKRVSQISCGAEHCLALTDNGKIYGWGSNRNGQVGCDQENGKKIREPIRLKNFPEFSIKSIRCSYSQSFVLTNDGLVYSWGYNNWCHLGHELNIDECVFEPQLIINIPNVISVCPSSLNTYFLTNERQLYFCGYFKDENNCDSFQKTPKLLNSKTEFLSLHSIPCYQKYESCALALSDEGVHQLVWDSITKSEKSSFFEFFAEKYQLSYKTIQITSDNNFDGNDLIDLQNHPLKFEEIFSIISDLGEGGFGIVHKVKDNFNHKLFAIKIINFKDKNVLDKNELMREVKTLSKCSGDYVVKYFGSWIEDNSCLYIQMELCSDNLKNIIQQKPNFFGRQQSEPMEPIEYFISCQLFQELLECVEYLHDKNIIHRDLKPENILIVENSKNNRFLKLCDFGLAKNGGLTTISHTRGMGTTNYMAPEVNNGTRYSAKCDIYSLGVIAMKIFDFNVFESDTKILLLVNKKLRNNWINLKKLILSMMNPYHKLRPTCTQILNEYHWMITKGEIKYHGLDDPHIMDTYPDNFLKDYFKVRIELSKQRKDTKLLSKLLKTIL